MKYIVLVTVLFLTQTVYGDYTNDYGDSDANGESDTTSQELKKVTALLADMNYEAAVQALKDLVKVEHRNADVWNLLGFSHRKMGNYKEADIAYRKSLIYQPDHKGALEYQGELFIATNQLDKARANLELLETLCPTGCEERSDLEAALAQVK